MVVPNSDDFLKRGTFYRQLAAGAKDYSQSEQWLDVAGVFEEIATDMRTRECACRGAGRLESLRLRTKVRQALFGQV